MFEVDGVSHRYGDRQVLHDLRLSLTEHRIALVGANGSGKSTFARMLNGLVVPTSGRVLVDGMDTRRRGRAVRRLVGFVFQDPDVQVVMPTVAEDVALGLRHRGLDPAEVDRRVAAVLDAYGLADLADHPAHLLSGGQKQLLAVAAVLALEPRCVVMDEPTTMLDLRNKRMIAEVVRGLPQRVVLATHDLELVEDFDRVLVFDEGRVVADGPPSSAVPAYLRLMASC